MANIKLIAEKNASEDIRMIYQEIKETMGWDIVPETFEMMAHDIDHLRSYWHHYKRVMVDGRVDIKTKKIIAFVVSAINNCGP